MRALLLFILIVLLAMPGRLNAQSYSVRLHRLDGSDASLASLLKLPKSFAQQVGAFSFVQGIVPGLQDAGYLAASTDSVKVTGDGYDVWVYVGEQWKLGRLLLTNLPQPIVTGTGIAEAQYANRPLTPKTISNLTERVLRWCEDNGYPFARAGLDSIVEDGHGGITAKLAVEPGALRKIDSIIIEGDVGISKAYLMRYLDIYEGGLYNEAHIRRISARLRDLPFLEEATSWYVSFRVYETKLFLNLKERKANMADGIFGLQPDNAGTGKLLFTIDAKAAFQNILGNGESFSFSYQKLQSASPRIKAEALYPYLLGTPFGADGHFDLYFKGREYRRTTYDAGGRYAITAQDYLRVFYKGYSNRIIEPDTGYIVANHRLPDNIDVSSGGAGLEVQSVRTNYRFNPSRGWTARISGEALSRNIKTNDGISGIRDGSGFDYGRLYDTITAQSYQYNISGDASLYLPLTKRIVLKTAYAGGWISGERLFQNELFQLGGFRLLRGFDEGSVFANQYHILTGELRLLLGGNSNFYIFSDNGWLQSKINGFKSEGLYNGFGLGASLDLKTGVMSISYGLGRSDANPLQLRQSKIHFGYVAYF